MIRPVTAVDDITEEEKEDYLLGLYKHVDEIIEDEVQGTTWDSDELNVYLTVAFEDGGIKEYKIPLSGLSFKQKNDPSVDEIVKYVREDIR